MPKMMVPVETETQAIAGAGTFQFSAARPEILDATEYTLVSLVVDVSGSVGSYKADLEKMIRNIAEACGKTNRVDNLMLRLTTFSDDLEEVHGFIPLNRIDPAAYPPLGIRGMTALYDATFESVGATVQYAETLTNQDYDVNAILFVITDGGDNASTTTPRLIADLMRKARQAETMDSIQTILIGVNDVDCKDYLDDFKDEAELDDFISVGDATIDNLARLGRFISKSVSSTSQALGSGVSAQLTF